jgi:elongation factor 1-alpha
MRKPRINIAFIGPTGHGKSTTAGHFLNKCGKVLGQRFKKVMTEISLESKEFNDEVNYAWLLDTLSAERVRGLSINCGIVGFETDKFEFSLIDTPGHKDFSREMIKGISLADFAVFGNIFFSLLRLV